MRQAIFAGSFDPLTTGHLWMIGEGARLFDALHVLVAVNPSKKAMFSPEERRAIIQKTIARLGLANIHVDCTSSEFIAQVATRKGVDYLLRGLRSTADFDLEDLLRQTNRDLFEGPQTVFLIPPKGLSSVSSSFVKALMGPVGWAYAIEEFLPVESYEALLATHLAARWSQLIQGLAEPDGNPERKQRALAFFPQHLLPSYRAEGRHYHGLSHLAHCLSEADALVHSGCAITRDQQLQLECAIFFHDLVHRGGPLETHPGESDEEASARYSSGFLRDVLDCPVDLHAAVEEAILATRYSSETQRSRSPLATWMRDVDLAILGRPRKDYARYARSVRLEYAEVPDSAYAQGRTRILSGFLELSKRGELFASGWFQERKYNQQAAENLAREIQALARER